MAITTSMYHVVEYLAIFGSMIFFCCLPFHLMSLFYILNVSHSKKKKQKNKKKEVQLYVFTDDTIFCVEKPKEPMKSIRITEFSSTTG